MDPENRRAKILEWINGSENGHSTIPDLSQRLGVSEMTIRRDLEVLEEKELVRRIHGGVLALNGAFKERSLVERSGQSTPQKVEIGRMAAMLVRDGESILLDSGTTTRQIARFLSARKHLTVVTNNIPITEELEPYPEIRLILLGGLVKHPEKCVIGPTVRQALENLHVDKAFIGTAGFSLQYGITDFDLAEVEIKQTMMRAAREIILVADSTKYNVSALAQVAPLSAVQRIVTDNGLPEGDLLAIEAAGIQVITPARPSLNPQKNRDEWR